MSRLRRLVFRLLIWLGRHRRVGLPIQRFLVRISAYSTENKLGPHIERLTGTILDYIEQWQPAVAVWVGPNPEGIDYIRDRSPNTFIVIRKHEDGRDWQATDPRWWADQIMAMVTDADGVVHKPDGAILWNEPFGHDRTDLFAAFDNWQVACHQRLQEYGVEGVFFNFGTGNFNKGDPGLVSRAFPKSCAAGKYFGIHEYGWPAMFNTSGWPEMEGWHTARWPYWGLPDDAKIIVTECGLTQAVLEGRPDEGYRTYQDGVTDDTYWDSLSWHNSQLVQDSRIVGAAIFDWGNHSWPTFEHEDKPELVQRIISISAPVPPELPEPPPIGGTMTIRVFDMNNVEQTLDWAIAKYGVAFRQAEVEPGQKVYRLVELREKSGPASLVTQVLNEAGNPIADMGVAFYWPDAPDPPEPPTDVLPHDWYPNFVHGPTNLNGDVGPGMGTGAYHGLGEGGPHAVWVRDPNIPTDICEKLGMLAGTNHDHLDQKFQLMIQGQEPTPPPPQTDLEARLRAVIAELNAVADEMGQPGAIKYVTVEGADGVSRKYAVTLLE